LQRWLETAEHRVTIPFAEALAEMVPPVAVRLRRDFGAVLALVRAHAMLHQATRDRDPVGRVVATVDDYAVVRELIADTISAGVEASVHPVVRETVAAVADLASDEGVMVRAVAARLDVDKSNASRRLRMAADGGYVRNLEDRRGRPARWVLGDSLPEDSDLLPQPDALNKRFGARERDGCAVARESGRSAVGDVDLGALCSAEDFAAVIDHMIETFDATEVHP
jgi:hypothetical protein